MSRQLTTMHSMIAGAIFVAVVLAPMLYFGTNEQVFNVLQWLESQAVRALLWFMLIITLVVILLLPGVLFSTGAGFVFGISTPGLTLSPIAQQMPLEDVARKSLYPA